LAKEGSLGGGMLKGNIVEPYTCGLTTSKGEKGVQ